ncbi:hypothetical protein PT974_07434 [Cladobotryum mycophilum]|uniref:Uncharacterized protein n=1 Tax=Cladobotryum mycophilum TaxID=491253 RepID=A0ABR0SQJ2_9HYPO
MGLHLRLCNSQAEAYGLTCRQVAHHPASNEPTIKHGQWIADSKGYHFRRLQNAVKHAMLQMCATELDDLHIDLQVRIADERKMKSDFELKQMKQECAERPNSANTFAEMILSHVTRIAEPDARVIGHISVMLPLETTSRGFTRDWALIQLDETKFAEHPTNRVFIKEAIAIGYVRLEGSLPPSASVDHHRSFEVAKRGAGTGFTFGITNEIKAVFRMDHNVPKSLWWSENFSKPGDSEAAVFDAQGRVVGIIGSGVIGAEKSPGIRDY